MSLAPCFSIRKPATRLYTLGVIVFVLHDVEGYTHEEIAEMLQVTPTTLHEMMKRLNISSESLVSS